MAAVTKNAGRQEILFAYVDFDWTDLEDTDGVYPAIELPPGAVVIGGALDVKVAWNNGTSADTDVGDSVDDNRYSAAPIALDAAARTALTITGYVTTGSTKTIAIKPVFVGTASSAGSARLEVSYYVEKRSFFAQA
jgi:hypothetical protein